MDSEKNILARPDGASPPQIHTQAYFQAVNQGNQHPVILLPQQGHAQIPSSVSAEPLPTVLMAYTPQARANTGHVCGKPSVILGGLQLAIGGLAIAMDSAGFTMQDYDDYGNLSAFDIFTSIWCGVFFFIAGGFAIGSGKKETKCLLLTTAVMESLSLLFAFGVLGIFSWEASSSHEGAVIAMAAMILICSVAQIICSIWVLVLCAKMLCPCCTKCDDQCCLPHDQHDQTFMFVNAVSPQNGQLVQVANPGAQPMNFALAYQHDQMVPSASHVPVEQNQTEGNITPPPPYNAMTAL